MVFCMFQIEAVLHQILQNLRILYAHHAPQLKPRPVRAEQGDTTTEVSTCVDPVEDMFNILESSALIPFIEVLSLCLWLKRWRLSGMLVFAMS